jgi:hypothetical protein
MYKHNREHYLWFLWSLYGYTPVANKFHINYQSTLVGRKTYGVRFNTGFGNVPHLIMELTSLIERHANCVYHYTFQYV